MNITQQKMYSTYSSEYVYDLHQYNTTYFEIPKNGSSTIRHYLAKYYGGAEIVQKFIDGGDPSGFTVKDYSTYKPRTHKMLVVRNPVIRIKSAYVSIYLSDANTSNKFSFKKFMNDEYPRLISGSKEYNAAHHINEDHLYQNHFKPQSWFVPPHILTDDLTYIIDMQYLSQFNSIMNHITGMQFDELVPSMNKTTYKNVEFDGMSDQNIGEIIDYYTPNEMALYDDMRQKSINKLSPILKGK